MLRTILGVGFLALVLGCPAAHATRIPASCKVFKKLEQPIPESLSEFEKLGPLMIRWCENDHGVPRAFLLLPPVRGRYDVCDRVEFAWKPTGFLNGLRESEPIIEDTILDAELDWLPVWRMVSKDRCPPQSSEQYVRTSGITDGLFAYIVRAWEAARASPEAFDKAFAKVAVQRPA